MVSIREFLSNEMELQKEIQYRDDISELERAHAFVMARRIQAWFRGVLTRDHLRMLHKSSTMIQKHWRGFMARKLAKSYLRDQVITMWRQYYYQCATKIQALWRGYLARKNGVNLPKYRQWLQTVYDKNHQALVKMKQYADKFPYMYFTCLNVSDFWFHFVIRSPRTDMLVIRKLSRIRFRNSESTYMKKVMERESMLWILFILFKLHHLLRTKCQSGVLTRVDKTRFTVIEEMMRSLEYTLYVERRRRDKCTEQPVNPPTLLLRGTYFARCEREIRDFEQSIEMGKASIRRDSPYEENGKFLKNVEKLREKLLSGKNGSDLPFRTVTNRNMPCAWDSTVRVTLGDYNPPEPGFTSIRPPRDKSKELNGDFRTIVKPDELYEAINKMDCPFAQLKLKCPIHDVTAE